MAYHDSSLVIAVDQPERTTAFCIQVCTYLLSMHLLLRDQHTPSHDSSEVVLRCVRFLINVAIHQDVVQSFGIRGVQAVFLKICHQVSDKCMRQIELTCQKHHLIR